MFAAAVRSLPDKSCTSDLLPTRLLKENVDILAPFLTDLFNCSLSTGVVPAIFKDAYITPLLKKPDMDPGEAKSYRPISKLISEVKIIGAIGRPTADRLLNCFRSASRVVGVSTSPLDGNCHFEGCVRHPVGDRCRRSVCTRTPGFVGSIRYGRPLDRCVELLRRFHHT
jgi:hypothetical protein